jgi:restriction system protein
MESDRMWMVRGDSGALYDEFRQAGFVSIGWWQLADVKPGESRQEIAKRYAERNPEYKRGSIISGASQVWRFVNEVKAGDYVVTYEPSRRVYLVGKVESDAVERAPDNRSGTAIRRKTHWLGEVERDQLSASTKNSLGSTLTLFLLPPSAASEVLSVLRGHTKPSNPPEIPGSIDDANEIVEEKALLQDVEQRSLEFIEDRVSALDLVGYARTNRRHLARDGLQDACRAQGSGSRCRHHRLA